VVLDIITSLMATTQVHRPSRHIASPCFTDMVIRSLTTSSGMFLMVEFIVLFVAAVAPVQVIAQLELWNERTSGRYEHKVYVLPKHLDEKVASLHLPKLGAKLTKLTPDQATYINVNPNGPFKPPHYRY